MIAGPRMGFILANVAYALARPDIKPLVAEGLRQLIAKGLTPTAEPATLPHPGVGVIGNQRRNTRPTPSRVVSSSVRPGSSVRS
jgi:hypothetical protein